MKVTLSPAARDYAVREARYLNARSQSAAHAFREDLKRLRLALQRFPAMGKPNEETPAPNTHRFVMGDYLVDYAVSKQQVLVLAIRHGRQRPPALSLDENFDLEESGSPSQTT